MLVGIGMGASLAFVLTPQSGRELRHWIGNQTYRGLEGLKAKSEAIGGVLQQWAFKGKQRTMGAVEAGKQAYHEATEWP